MQSRSIVRERRRKSRSNSSNNARLRNSKKSSTKTSNTSAVCRNSGSELQKSRPNLRIR